MFNYFEKFFPEVVSKIKSLSVAKRVILLLGLIPISASATYLFALRSELFVLLQKEVLIPFYAVLLAATVIPMILGLVALVAHVRTRRRRLKAFCTNWVAFRGLFQLLHLRIETWLVKSGPLNHDNEVWNDVAQLLDDFCDQRTSLRRLLHLIGEGSLLAKIDYDWEDLRREHDILKNRRYDTPFSFLLDINAPIASVHHYGDAIWAALQISDHYIEYLAYEYSYLEKVRIQNLAKAIAEV